jgi:hypothetical protein
MLTFLTQVWDLPPHAEVLARSDKTSVEMFRLGDRAMGVQGHPEYSKDILMSIADRLLQHNLILVSSGLKPISFVQTSVQVRSSSTVYIVPKLTKMYLCVNQDCQVDVAKASFDVRTPDKELWRKVCTGFLKGRLQSQQQKQHKLLL